MMTLAPLLRPAHHRVLSPFREVLAQCHSWGWYGRDGSLLRAASSVLYAVLSYPCPSAPRSSPYHVSSLDLTQLTLRRSAR